MFKKIVDLIKWKNVSFDLIKEKLEDYKNYPNLKIKILLSDENRILILWNWKWKCTILSSENIWDDKYNFSIENKDDIIECVKAKVWKRWIDSVDFQYIDSVY